MASKDIVSNKNTAKRAPSAENKRDSRSPAPKVSKEELVGSRAQPKPNGLVAMPSTNVITLAAVVSLTAEQRENIRKLALEIIRAGIPKLKTEYDELRALKYSDLTKLAMMANLDKVRYKDVPCWDQTRVRLTFPPGQASDFIHANYIRHEFLSGTFICTQGPLESTVVDFWRMVWQENVSLICMLCQCVEMKRTKCAQYWQKASGEVKTSGPFKITTNSVNTSDENITITKLTIQWQDQQRQVEHRHWISWPDKTVPKSSVVAFRLLTMPRDFPNNPAIIHCSAGVGRSGTLLMLELIQRQLLSPRGNNVQIPALVKDIRSQRAHSMVQTEDQYVFVCFSVVQLAVAYEVLKSSEAADFYKNYENYLIEFAATSEKGSRKGGPPKRAASVRRTK